MNEKEKEQEQEIKKMLEAIGSIAELATVFFQSALATSKSIPEATAVTQAYLGAMLSARPQEDQE